MKRIMLVCNAGMSTSMLVNQMKKEAEKRNLECRIWAISEMEVEENWEEADVILLGPQIKFLIEQIRETVQNSIPVQDINQMTYGRMDGCAVLDLAFDLIEKFEK